MTKVIRLGKAKQKSKFIKNKGKNRLYSNSEIFKTLLLIISVISIFTGSLIYKISPIKGFNQIISEKISFLNSAGFSEILIFLLKLDFVFLFVIFIIGTSFFGISISFFVPIIKCNLIGYVGSFFYNNYELKGILFCLLLFFPYVAITTSSLIYATNESIYMSQYIYNIIIKKNTADDISTRLYLIRYLILTTINAFCAIINSLLIVIIFPKIDLI